MRFRETMIGVPIPGDGRRDGVYRQGESGWVPDGLADLLERRGQAERTFDQETYDD